MKWHVMSEKPTNEQPQYLLIVKFGKHKFYQLGRYISSYHRLSKYEFDEEEGGGFYRSDPDWGFVKIIGVLAWSELKEVPECFEPIE